ncbi:MAG: hypothetical protein VW806_09440 [Halieaceae bacterium]
MRLVVEEAQDHSTCMEIVRQRHGADCVVVHSFRVEDQYRIVVALETESRSPASAPLTDAVRDVISPTASAAYLKWDTFIDDAGETTPGASPAMTEDLANEPAIVASPLQASPEVSSGLIALAARIKALEAAHQPAILEPETEEFRAIAFSEVLANTVATDSTDADAHQLQPFLGADPLADRVETLIQPMSSPSFETPMVATKDLEWSPSPEQAFVSTAVDEPAVPRVCTSEGAENFATLLSGCIAIASKSMSLSGQTQLKIVAGQGI